MLIPVALADSQNSPSLSGDEVYDENRELIGKRKSSAKDSSGCVHHKKRTKDKKLVACNGAYGTTTWCNNSTYKSGTN